MTRTRKTDGKYPSALLIADTPGGNTVINGLDIQRVPGSFYKEVRDVVTPRYKEKIQRGLIVLNPFSLIRQKWSGDARPVAWSMGPHEGWGSRLITGDIASVRFIGPDFNTLTWLPGDAARARDLCLTEVYAKANKSEMQSTVFAQELGKTLAMIRSPLKGAAQHLNRYLKSVRKQTGLNNVTSAAGLSEQRKKDLGKAWANAHLEYSLGWKPTVMDINSAFSAFSQAAEPKFPALRATRASWTGSGTIQGETPGESSMGLSDWMDKRDYICNLSVHAGLLYRINEPNWQDSYSRAFGLGRADILPHVWETLPLSWVVDYFSNVGDWLAASVLRPELEILGNWLTEIEKWNCRFSTRGHAFVNWFPHRDYYFQSGTLVYESERVTRTINHSVPSTPTIDTDGLRVNQALNLAALLTLGFKDVRPTVRNFRL